MKTWQPTSLLLLLMTAPCLLAQGSGSKNPQPPSAPLEAPAIAAPEVTADAVNGAVSDFLARSTVRGTLRLYDPVDRTEHLLSPVDVVTRKVMRVGRDQYVVSASFHDGAGKEYLLDFIVSNPSAETMTVLPKRTVIRAVDGTARYEWKHNDVLDLYERSDRLGD